MRVRHRVNFRMISECAMSMIHTTRARQCFTQSAVWLEIVICDEIGSKEDVYAVEKSVNCGVRIISSTHCANEYELKQKANMASLMKTGAFQTLVFLSNRTHAGEIVKISQVGDNFAV